VFSYTEIWGRGSTRSSTLLECVLGVTKEATDYLFNVRGGAVASFELLKRWQTKRPLATLCRRMRYRSQCVDDLVRLSFLSYHVRHNNNCRII